MKPQAIALGSTSVALYLLGILILSCLVSIMVAFMGGSLTSQDMQTVYALQTAGIFASLATAAICLVSATVPKGVRAGLKSLWEHSPGWLLFAFLMLNLLVIAGTWSYSLAASAIDPGRAAANYISLFCMSVTSLAYLAIFATSHRLERKPPYSKARW